MIEHRYFTSRLALMVLSLQIILQFYIAYAFNLTTEQSIGILVGTVLLQLVIDATFSKGLHKGFCYSLGGLFSYIFVALNIVWLLPALAIAAVLFAVGRRK